MSMEQRFLLFSVAVVGLLITTCNCDLTDDLATKWMVDGVQKFSPDAHDLLQWAVETSSIPRDDTIPVFAPSHDADILPSSARSNLEEREPRTDGEGLQIPQNKKSAIRDLLWGDPEDPNVLFRQTTGFKSIHESCRDKRKYYYRTYDGSCNWIDEPNWEIGKAWRVYQRDTPHGPEYNQATKNDHKFTPYARPIVAPNPRELSDKFFTNISGIHINHTPFLTGIIESIIHDVSWSETGPETIRVPIPCGDYFNPTETCRKDVFFTFNKTRMTRIPEDTIDRSVNGATTWVDGSTIYGNDETSNKRLRSGINGKLKVQRGADGGLYPPTSATWGRSKWFDAGDARVNQDWYVMAISTLWIREHNRLADILSNSNPSWNDEQVFLTTRSVITCKMFLTALAYMRGYFKVEEMKKYQILDDDLQLVRLAYGFSYTEVNPLMKFGKLGLDPAGKGPATASDEMSVGYRFHDLIPSIVPIYDSDNQHIKDYKFMDTLYTPAEFMKVGLDAVLRGAVRTILPGFHSGVHQELRNAEYNLGDPTSRKPFDIVMWSIMRERSRGLPTFNEYFRFWNSNNKHMQVKIRTSFAEFTSNTTMQQYLINNYDKPDQVDLVVGLQLDNETFPGMQIPKSFVIVSLLSLYSLGISDRHGPLHNLLSCLRPPNTVFDCRTTNALEDILWTRSPIAGSPNARKLSTFWLDEIDYQYQGILGLWRLVTRNTNVQCVPVNPLFIENKLKDVVGEPYNPIVCTEQEWKIAYKQTKM